MSFAFDVSAQRPPRRTETETETGREVGKWDLLTKNRNRHCVRRTALRLLVSPGAAANAPGRTRSTTALLQRPAYPFPRVPPQCRVQQQQQYRWNSDEARRKEEGEGIVGTEEKGEAVKPGLRTTVNIETETETEIETGPTSSTDASQTINSTTTANTRTNSRLEDAETPATQAEVAAEADAQANVNPDGAEGLGPYSRPKKASTGAFRYVEQPGKPKETVFVSNLFFDINADDLRKHMEQFGVVENATVITDSRGISKG